MTFDLIRDGAVVNVSREVRDGRAHVTVGGEELVFAATTIDAREARLVTADGRHLRVAYARSGGRLLVWLEGRQVELIAHAGDADDDTAGAGGFTPEVTAPMPGKVLEVLVAAGDEVAHDAPLVRLEAMKMEQTIRASTPARVREVRATVGAMVGPGAVLLVLEALA